jgi:hypothetical protein
VTTHHYVEADVAMKERALARFQQPEAKIQRYRAARLAGRLPEDVVMT